MALDDRLMLRSYDDLLSYLKREGAAFAEVRTHHAVELQVHSPPVEGVLALVWLPDPQLVQFLFPLPFAVSSEHVAAVESALARINHALMLPGFGLNHSNGTVYYRLVLPRQISGGMEPDEIRRAVNTVLTTVRDFWLPLRAVIEEGAAAEGAVSASAKVSG